MGKRSAMKEGRPCEVCGLHHPERSESLKKKRRKEVKCEKKKDCVKEVKVRALVAYEGRFYHGFQRGAGHDSVWEVPTVQIVLEEAVSKALGLLDADVTCVGLFEDCENMDEFGIGRKFGWKSGVTVAAHSRTDAGVSAEGQVVSFWVSKNFAESLNKSLGILNDFLCGKHVQIIDIESVNNDFSLRHEVKGKRYRYTIFDGTGVDQFEKVFNLYHPKMRVHRPEACKRLNVEVMAQAARQFVGTHDFQFFSRRLACQDKSTTLRRIHLVRVFRSKSRLNVHIDTENDPEGDFVHFFVDGDSFLFRMVRIMAQSLIDIGKGKKDSQCLLKETTPQPFTLPNGLSLANIFFEEESFHGKVLPWPYK